ncbi:hypothetical protein B0H34DRAFT_795124 [Crassisporium funariophilum]|nr:hypothetical protein B0H34DRAFT_795124 [Crassisporium funariophilum]
MGSKSERKELSYPSYPGAESRRSRVQDGNSETNPLYVDQELRQSEALDVGQQPVKPPSLLRTFESPPTLLGRVQTTEALAAPNSEDLAFVKVPPPLIRQRTAQACDKCRERKTKCSGHRPVCLRCTNRGLICEYSVRETRIRGPLRSRIQAGLIRSISPSDFPAHYPSNWKPTPAYHSRMGERRTSAFSLTTKSYTPPLLSYSYSPPSPYSGGPNPSQTSRSFPPDRGFHEHRQVHQEEHQIPSICDSNLRYHGDSHFAAGMSNIGVESYGDSRQGSTMHDSVAFNFEYTAQRHVPGHIPDQTPFALAHEDPYTSLRKNYANLHASSPEEIGRATSSASSGQTTPLDRPYQPDHNPTDYFHMQSHTGTPPVNGTNWDFGEEFKRAFTGSTGPDSDQSVDSLDDSPGSSELEAQLQLAHPTPVVPIGPGVFDMRDEDEGDDHERFKAGDFFAFFGQPGWILSNC